MLRPYPIDSTAENWLHDCLVGSVKAIHAHVEGGTAPEAWKDCIPKQHAKKLARYTSIHKKLEAYAKVLDEQASAVRLLALEILEEQNQIEDLLACQCDCRDVRPLPEKLREAVKELFYAGFKALTGLGIRDRQYELVYESLPSPECPFCGIEYFDSPMRVEDDIEFDAAPREDLDHYLAFKHYAFAGCNLSNLVPTCKKCNERYKHEADVLRDDRGIRRPSFPLFVPKSQLSRRISVSLDASTPFGGTKAPLPSWRITFTPNCLETSTWDSVFHVSERYTRDVLTHQSFVTWLGNFGNWCRTDNRQCNSQQELLKALDDFIRSLEDVQFTGRDELRISAFKMLRHHCNTGNARLEALLCDYANQRY